MLAYMNATNSCHSNSADEPFTTPSQEYVRLAAHAQAILLEESGLFRHMMGAISGSPGMAAVASAVEAAILAEFRELDHLGGVLPAMEQRYQRAQIQAAAHVYERQINDGTRPIIGVNRYAAGSTVPQVAMVRTALAKRKKQLARLAAFKKKNAKAAPKALAKLQKVVESNSNVFAELIKTVEVCSLGQITHCLHETVGHFRPTV
jgi:methylmalonyl-CoA mutase